MKTGATSGLAALLTVLTSWSCSQDSPANSSGEGADAAEAMDAVDTGPIGDSLIIVINDAVGVGDVTRDTARDISAPRDTGTLSDATVDRDSGTDRDASVSSPDTSVDPDGTVADVDAIDASCSTADAPPDAGCGQSGEVCCPNATCASCNLSCAGTRCTCMGPCVVSRETGAFPAAGTNILRSDGTIWYYATSTTRPTVVSDTSMTPVGGFTKVVTSASFSCGIQRDRTVWCWWNYAPGLATASDGQLGDGTQRASQTPVQVVTSTTGPDPLTDVVSLGTNVTTTCAVRADTTVYCWGNGSMGQFGNGTRTRSFVATPALASAGGPLFSGADSVCVGNSHVCTHNQDDTVWCWGWNAYEQIGNGTTIDAQYPSEVVALSHRAKQVECGWYYNCARVDERVYCWGYNMYGMGNGTLGRGVAVLKEPGEEPGRGVDFTGVSDLRVTNNTSCILRAPEQSLWCWGQWTDGFEHRYPWQPSITGPDAGSETLNHPYAWDFGVRACFVTTDGVAFLGDAPAKYPIECPQ